MRTRVLVTGAALMSAAFVALLASPLLGETAAGVLSDLGQLGAAAFAAAGCAMAARRCDGARRRAWTWLSIGTGGWAAGQSIWTYYELVLGREVPFPSLADIGFLVFPVAAAIGLAAWLGTQSHQLAARGRDVLDGAIIAASLLVLSWVAVLPSAIGSDEAGLPFVLSLAYPVGDLVVATLALIALSRGGATERTTLTVLTLGLAGLAFADSGYVYVVNLGMYESADLISAGWVFGFLFVGVSGLTVRRNAAAETAAGRVGTGSDEPPDPGERVTLLQVVLPYLPLTAAGVVLSADLLIDPEKPAINLFFGLLLVVLVLTRQYLAMADNQRLLVELAAARDQLRHQTLHDALTGVANRVLFSDRMERALTRPGAHIGVLYCDLDDFKQVNDQLGHAAGDAVLERVAQRLVACVRAEDTVARLGGDEFAILLEDGDRATVVAERVIAAMRQPLVVDGHAVQTSLSVGISHHVNPVPSVRPPETRARDGERRRPSETGLEHGDGVDLVTAAELLLRDADRAMYVAKGAGKSRAVLAGSEGGETDLVDGDDDVAVRASA